MRKCVAPVFIRHHWVACSFSNNTINVYDSAPSPIVHRDLVKFCKVLWPTASVTFVPSPHQTYGSEDCGVFTVIALFCLSQQWDVPESTFAPANILALRQGFETITRSCDLLTIISKHIQPISSPKTFFEGGEKPFTPNEIRDVIALAWRQKSRTSVFFKAEWSYTDDHAEKHVWFGTIDRPRNTRGTHQQKSWPTTWTHHLQEGMIVPFEDSKVVVDRTPNTNTVYWTFTLQDSAPQPSSETFLVPRMERVKQAISELIRPPEHPKPVHQPPSGTSAPLHHDSTDSTSDSDSDSEFDAEGDQLDPVFQQGYCQALPVIAHMTGATILELLSRPDVPLPFWAEEALTHSTRLAHARALRRLTDLPPSVTHLRAARAIIEHLYRWKERVGWSWPTMAKNAAQTAAALRLLPIYKHVTHGVIMQQDVMWQQATEALMKQARSHHTVRTPLAMSPQIFSSTLTAETSVERQVVLLLMWYTSGRVGDILQLHHEDVVRQPDGTLTITFQRGKAVKFRGPYTVATTCLNTFEYLYSQVLKAHCIGKLFPNTTTEDMLRTFRLSDPRMEAKSVRRGSLQCMASSGVPMETLMKYAGHTKEKTTLRYLNWGRLAQATHTAMATAGVALHPH
jgi:hypothetical protein